MKEEIFRIHQMELDEMVEEIYNDRETIKDLEQQLQSYKQKEDKLREYVNNIKSSGVNSHFDAPVIKEYILQILNEGDK